MEQYTGEITLFNFNDIITSPDEPIKPAEDQIWIDTNDSVFKQWKGSKWDIISNWQPAIDDVNTKIQTTHQFSEQIKSELTAVDNKYGLKVTDIKNSYDTLLATSTSNTNKITTINETIKEQETNFSNLSLRVDNINASVGGTKESLKTLELNVQDINSNTYKKSELYTKSEVESHINIVKDEINLGVDSKYETKQNTQTLITNAINDSKNFTTTQISEISSTLSDTKASIDVSLKGIDSKIASNEQSYKDIQKTISNIDSSITTINESIQTNKSQIAGTLTSLDKITSRVSSTEESTHTLTTNYNSLNGTVGTLNSSLDGLSKDTYRKTEVYTKTETDGQIKIAKDEINLNVSSNYATTTTVTSNIASALGTAKSYADSKKDEAIKSSQGYTDGQITQVNKTITANESAINVFKDSISSKVTAAEENISSINGTITNHTQRLNTAESKISPTAITNSISESLNGGGTITTTTTITDKNGFTVKHSDGDYTTLSGKGLLRYRQSGDLRGEYHYLFHRGSVSNVTSNTTVRIQLPDDFKGLDYGISWWAGNVFPEKNTDLIFAANVELVNQNKAEGWFEIKATLMVRNPGSESSPNWRGKMNVMYMAIA